MELSGDPQRESVVIVAHGPNGEEEKLKWLKTMENPAERCAEHVQRVRGKSLPIYEMAGNHLRAAVRQLSASSEVIVVPLLISRGGIERGILERLEGLEFRWSGKTILPSAEITAFIESRIAEVMNPAQRD